MRDTLIIERIFNMKRTSLFSIAALALTAVSACSSLPAANAPAPVAPVAATTAAVAVPANAVTTGTFSGLSDHITTGRASIVGSAGAYQLVLASDFSLDGAPDPIVGFGQNGTFNPATKLGALKQINGAQVYDLPADFNPAEAGEVYVWCEKFSVPLGVASFTPATTVASGTFSGRSDHITTGQASITGTPGNYTLTLGADFTLDGAPDPVVGFGTDGAYSAASKVGSLQAITGEQSYSLPADFDPAAVNEVYIWCEKFSVPLGVASL